MSFSRALQASLLLLLFPSSARGFAAVVAPAEAAPVLPADVAPSLELLPMRATPALWRRLAPRPWEAPRGLDTTVEWRGGDAVPQVMRDWVDRRLPVPDPAVRARLAAELAATAAAFEDYVDAHAAAAATAPRAFRARLVAGRGATGAARCPQWHVDHVPVRLLQALAGPGCEYVVAEAADTIDWGRVNALSTADTAGRHVRERNRLLVPGEESPALVRRAPEGRAALLVGNRWWDLAGERDRAPCLHRSPQQLRPWEGRVLLTMDIVDSM